MTAAAPRHGTTPFRTRTSRIRNAKTNNTTNMKNKRKSTTDRLSSYLTAAIGISTVVGTADAAIVSLDISAFDGPNAGLADYTDDVFLIIPGNVFVIANQFQYPIGSVGFTGAMAILPELNLAMKSDGTGLYNFAAGASIGASTNWNSVYVYDSYFNKDGSKQLDWNAGSFMGFRANSNTATPLYGWLEVTWDADTNTFEFLSGAYDNTGAAITAGPIPEPASVLSTMGLLASGLLIRRRKLAA
jgi:hypothetical protein